MRCISAYVYVVGVAEMTKIFGVCHQAVGLPSQSSEYTFECCHKLLGRYGISLSNSSPGIDLFLLFVYVDWPNCWCRYLLGVRCAHVLSPVLEARSVQLAVALSRRLPRRRMRCRAGYYILCISPSVGLRRGYGLFLINTFF